MDIVKYNKTYKNKLNVFLKHAITDEYNIKLDNIDLDIYEQQKNQMLILLDDNKNVIGVCGIRDTGEKTGEINLFCVDKDFRKKGYGKLLYVWMEVFINLNFEEVILCSNKAFLSDKFFQKLGFTPYRYENNGDIYFKKEYAITEDRLTKIRFNS